MQARIATRADGSRVWVDPTRMYEYPNCSIQLEEISEEERENLRVPLAIIEITIPEEVYKSDQIQQLIGGFRTIYSGLDIRTFNGNTHIGNIDLADIKKFITKETYEQMKALGTIRPDVVTALFEEEEEEDKDLAPNDDKDEKSN